MNKSINLAKSMDSIFIISSIIFNILVSILYIATKFGNMELVQVIGIKLKFDELIPDLVKLSKN